MMDILSGKKTYLAAIGLIAYAGIGWALTILAPEAAAAAGIHVDLKTFIPLVLNALGLGGLRAAIAKA